jgi:glucokinase
VSPVVNTISRTTVVAVDIGATSIKGARVAIDGSVVAERSIATASGAEAIAQVLNLCASLADASTAAAGIAVPGVIDTESGSVSYAANLSWQDVPLRDLIADQLGVPVSVTHDVRAACIAEIAVGLGKEVSDMLVVVIGGGVGSGVVIDRQQLHGATGAATELGHLQVRPDGEPCACGQRGCLEVYASAAGVERRYVALGGDPAATAVDVAIGADAIARNVWGEATRSLAQALAAATVLIDPALIVLGGGLSVAGARLLDPVRAALKGNLEWRSAPAVALSPLGSGAGRTGAAISAWRSLGNLDIAHDWSLTPAQRTLGAAE